MNKTCYLRVEGVNLDSFVYDCNELSTVRGGGLLLLDMPKRVEKKFCRLKLKRISAGASSGLFEFDGARDDPQEFRLKVERFLRQDPQLREASFVVDCLPLLKKDAFRASLESLLAANRWRQMQSPSVVYPRLASKRLKVCKVDLMRPADKKLNDTPKAGAVSRSVKVRWDYGRENKQGLYAGIIKDNVEREFTFDLKSLTQSNDQALSEKMAILYLDGNSFGAIQRGCSDAASLKKYDEGLRRCRNDFLTSLVKSMDDDASWRTPLQELEEPTDQPKREGNEGSEKKRYYRLETLLWGGDELMFVVPAWKGWQALSRLFEEAQDRTLALGGKSHRLTYSGGLVFCHHNAPIHRLKNLAHNLAESAKKVSRERNHFAYQVLESFDHVGRDLERFRAERVPHGESIERLVLPGESMGGISSVMGEIRRKIPRRQLHRLVRLALGPSPDPRRAEKLREELEQRLRSSDQEKLAQSLGQGIMGWLHLAELWDFIPCEGKQNDA